MLVVVIDWIVLSLVEPRGPGQALVMGVTRQHLYGNSCDCVMTHCWGLASGGNLNCWNSLKTVILSVAEFKV